MKIKFLLLVFLPIFGLGDWFDSTNYLFEKPTHENVLLEEEGQEEVLACSPDGYNALMALYNNTHGASWTNSAGNNGETSEKYDFNFSHPDYPALEALYNATDGDNWSNTLSNIEPWDVSPQSNCFPCDWYGVTCDNDGRVIGLDLNGNDLNGNIPALIGTLNRLRWLNLSNNQLSGGIPIEIGNFLLLEYLFLGNNQLTGGIPNEIGNLSNLLVLQLHRNFSLKGHIPNTIGNLFNLQELLLYEDSLSGNIPTQIGNLTNLVILDFWTNELSGNIPTQIGNLTNLEFISLGVNNLSGPIPNSIGNLNKVKDIRLNDNQLTSIPTEIGKMSSLQFAYMSSNQLASDLPSQFANLDSLKVLRLHFNQLTGTLPPQYSDLTVLQELSLHDNNLTGCIPSGYDVFCGKSVFLFNNNSPDLVNNFNDFCDFDTGECTPCTTTHPDAAALIAFYQATSGNGWKNNTNWDHTGDISCDPCADNWFGISCEFIGGVDRVTSIHMFSNNLVGSLPPEIGDLSELKDIGLQGFNQFLSGPIPSEIGNLSNLEYLNVAANQISGSIPASIGNLTELTNLLLFVNQISGPIPESLGNLDTLIEAHLGGNDLTGSIPATLGNLIYLRELILFENNLSDSLPPELGKLINLTDFNVSGNTLLEGCIPESYQTFCTIGTNVDFNNTDINETDFLAFCASNSGTCANPPACPIYLFPENNIDSVGNGIELGWIGDSTALGYLVYVGTDGGGNQRPTNLVNGDTVSVNGPPIFNLTNNLAPNSTYYWQVIPYSNGGNTSNCMDSIWSFQTAPIPINDLCADAEELMVDTDCVPVLFSNLGSTNSGQAPLPQCKVMESDVWFKVMMPASGDLSIKTSMDSSTNWGLFDVDMEVYSGGCSSGLTDIACGGDIDPNPPFPAFPNLHVQLDITDPALANQMVFVRVWGAFGEQGTFNICAYEPEPANCNPCDTFNFPNDPFMGDTTFIACDSIISQMQILNAPMDTSNVTYQSGISITLEPGFQVQASATFLAHIAPCNNFRTEEPDEIASYRESPIVNQIDLEDFQLKVYPNPFTTHTTIEFTLKQASPVQIQLLDLTGKVLEDIRHQSPYEVGNHQLILYNDQWDSGIYLLRLTSSEGQLVKKLMVVR